MYTTSKFAFEVQEFFSAFGLKNPQLPPNKKLERIRKSVTDFARAKPAPLCCAAELRR